MASISEDFATAQQRHLAGDFSSAIPLYQRVVDAEPANLAALTLLALACHQAGDMSKAEAWYRQAVTLDRENADLRFKLALVLASLGRADEAKVEFREIVRLRPDAAEPWNNLGNVLFLQGKIEEAIPCYREAVRLRPTYAEACLNLGNALREDDRLTEGLAWYREAVRLRPDHPKARNNLAAALLETGEHHEAEQHFRESLRLRPASPQILSALAANGFYTDADPGSDQLKAWLTDPKLSMMDASLLHSTLSALLERDDQFDAAFHHRVEANRLRGEIARQAGEAFDPTLHSRFVDRLIEVFTPEYFKRFQGMGSDTELPVFIVGMPRSGSSLVEQILSHHPDIQGVGELRCFARLATRLPQRLGTDEPYPECAARLDTAAANTIAEVYLTRIQELVSPARRITDKLLDNFLHLGLAATLFPRARVIHCRRDPLDTCVSCFFQVFRQMNFTWDLVDLGRYYKDYERLMAHWRSALPLAMMDVVYEELIADTEAGSRRLIEFLGLPWDDRCLRFHENPRAVRTASKLQVRRPIYTSSIGRWRRHAQRLGPLQHALGLG
jgi:tetratricopeptide (TPR) repeat protein